MKTKLLAATALGCAALLGAAAIAQTPAPAAAPKAQAAAPLASNANDGQRHEAGYVAPKTKWGAPDLQGYWNNTSLTSLSRGPDAKSLRVSEREAERLANRNILVVLTKEDNAQAGKDPNNTDLLKDKNNDRGYNAFWIDPGTKLATVKGEIRTSWITEPTNGRIPYKPGAARSGGFAITNFDGPETRPQAERCIIGFSGSYGPIMNNGMYNSTMQFVQTPTHVMIQVEMIHDVRVIPIVKNAAEARHSPLPKWGGDSVGWYEGDTLVVETRNPHPSQRAMISKDGKLTERFSRWNDKQILYSFEVDDPSMYTQVWKGEMALNASEPLYEYACHEGNYAMAGILAGARELESQGKTPGMGPGIAAGLVLPRDETGGEGFN
ncbi:MAG TPA: hypothetical protein VIA80_04380 [Hyphomonadaceae bacterium]|jgi:hypothetical protein